MYLRGDINSYFNSYIKHLGKNWTHHLNPPDWEIFKIRNTDLQLQTPGHDWQNNKKK